MISLGELKEELQETDSEEFDELIEAIEIRAVAYVELATGRYFGLPASTIEYLNGNALRELRIPQPLSAGAPAPVVENESSPGTWETVPAADYQVIDRELRHNTGWVQGTRNYRITFTRGYPATSQDNPAWQSVLDVVKKWFREQQMGGNKSESIGPYSYTADDSSSPSAEPPDSLTALRGWVYA